MNLLITGAWGDAKAHIDKIEDMGHHVTFLQQEKDELPCETSWVEGLICNGLFLYHPIEAFSNLRYIQLTSVGFDRVPMDYIHEHGIEIHNAKDVYSIPMAEHALACALWFYRGLGGFRKNQEKHSWIKNRGLKELNGKTVLIIGCGNVGTACAKAFGSLCCSVIGVDCQIGKKEHFSALCHIDDLKFCLSEADIVVITVPLTNETRGLIGEDAFGCMKDGLLLINLSRGEVIDTDALVRHLPRLGGTALDVFEEEPLKEDSPLWDMENVLITPHNCFVGDGNGERIKKVIMDNLGIIT